MLVNRALHCVGLNVNHFLGPASWRSFRIHQRAQVVHRRLPRTLFADFFKFAFVRNPWDRLVSYYHHVIQQPEHRRHRRFCRIDGFPAYVRWETTRDHNRQVDFLTDPGGDLLVDFVGYYENLADDFRRVTRRLSLEVELPRLNGSQHRDYRSYYDDATAELVADFWQADIQQFGYDFEGRGS